MKYKSTDFFLFIKIYQFWKERFNYFFVYYDNNKRYQ